MASSKCFIELEPNIKAALSKSENVNKLLTHIRNYLGKNAELLAKASVEEKPGFSVNEDQQIVFDCMGIDRPMVLDVLTRTTQSDVHKGWAVWQGEQYLAFAMCIRYFEKVKNKMASQLMQLYFDMLWYNALHRKYFKYPPKHEVMEYTIANLSNKYDIKRIGNLMGTLRKISDNNHRNALSRLLSNDDDQIFVYQRDLRTRLNGFLKALSIQYYTNYEQGNYLNVDKDKNTDEEGNEYSVDRKSDSAALYNAAESFSLWFITNRLNERLVKICSGISPEISPFKFASVLNGIKEDKKGRLKKVVIGLLEQLSDIHGDATFRAIHTKEFPIFCIRMLSKSNSKNESINMVKNNVDSLLNDYCSTFKTTKREATKINYRKALMSYIAFGIQLQRK